MADKQALAELDADIAAVRDNLRQLAEQAAAQSGAADEDLNAERITQQEAQLALLLKRARPCRNLRHAEWTFRRYDKLPMECARYSTEANGDTLDLSPRTEVNGA